MLKFLLLCRVRESRGKKAAATAASWRLIVCNARIPRNCTCKRASGGVEGIGTPLGSDLRRVYVYLCSVWQRMCQLTRSEQRA